MKLKRTICIILSIMMVLSVLAGCQAEQSDNTNPPTTTDSPQSSAIEQTPADKLEFDSTLESIRVVVDGIVHNFDVQVKSGAWYISAQDAQTAFGDTFTEEYVALDAYAQDEDIRYRQDEVLTAAYFSTYQGYDGADKNPIDMDWEASQWVDVTEGSVLTVNSEILTPELLAAVKNAPEVTADNHPIWTGLIFGAEYSGTLVDETERIQQTADWGFNSVRLKVDFESFFNYNATQADVTALSLLDKYVAYAIQNNLHLNLCLTTLPGRTSSWDEETFTSTGDFDLFLNPEKQEIALRLWQVLTERYRDVPSAFLSFTPFWGAFNPHLSTGLPAPEYSFSDIGAFAVKVCDEIHEVDEQRLIIIEVDTAGDTPPNKENCKQIMDAVGSRSYVIYQFAFGSAHYTYANITATDGAHFDNQQHSFALADYPTVWPSLSPHIIDTTSPGIREILSPWPIDWDAEGKKNLTLEGLLPAGTVLELYLAQTYGGSIVIKADDNIIFEEVFDHMLYEQSEMVSQYIQYSTTDKKISITLEQNVDLLEIAAVGGAFRWTGISLVMPEEYAQEDWYFATDYDVFLGVEEEVGLTRRSSSIVRLWPYGEFDRGRHAVIHDDLSYTTDKVYTEVNADILSSSAKALAELAPNCIIFYESATFAAVTAESMLSYYEDLLFALKETGINWWSNDWYNLMLPPFIFIAGAEGTPYDGWSGQLYVELLQLLQRYQSTERT